MSVTALSARKAGAAEYSAAVYSVEPSFDYIPALDGLRAVSIVLVLLSHFGLGTVVPGGFGVSLFFFVSGFLITRQLFAELSRTGRVDVKQFYLRRLFRLMPAALLYVVLSTGFFVAIGGSIGIADLLSAVFYGANYYDLYVQYDTNLPLVPHPFNIQWSLAIEEHFYLVFPFVVLLLGTRAKRLALVLLAAIVAVTAWRWMVYQQCAATGDFLWCGERPLERTYKGTDTRIDAIMYGAVLAMILAVRHWADVLNRIFGWPLLATAALLLALSFVLPGQSFRETHRYALQGVAGMALIHGLLFWPGLERVRKALSARPLIWIGRISYSLYLFHWLAMMIACYALQMSLPTLHTLPTASGAVWVATAGFGTLCLTLASFHLIETPMIRWRRRFGSHGATGIPLSVSPMANPTASPMPGLAHGGIAREA